MMSMIDASNDTLQERIDKRLRKALPQEAFTKWIDDFSLESIGKDKIVFTYSGTANLAEFNKRYRSTFCCEVCLALGTMADVQIKKTTKTSEETKPTEKSKGGKRKIFSLVCLSILFICIAIFLAVSIVSFFENRNFKENFYSVSSVKVQESFRVIQISDLHSSTFGKNNEKLIDRIQKLKPDIILMTGDCWDDSDKTGDAVLALCRACAETAPTFYIYGNNETSRLYNNAMTLEALDKSFGFDDSNRDPNKLFETQDDLLSALENTGVTVLRNEQATVEVGGNTIDIYGVLTSNPSAFWPYAGESFSAYINEDTDHFKLTAIHEPFIFTELTEATWGDLMVSGHTHGGTIRVPFLGPLYVKSAGLFPERKNYCVYGRYNIAGRPLIVSAGLTNKDFVRINNEPELVIIDVSKY